MNPRRLNRHEKVASHRQVRRTARRTLDRPWGVDPDSDDGTEVPESYKRPTDEQQRAS